MQHKADSGFERVPCVICEVDDCETILVAKDRLHGIPGEFPVVRCRRCGLVYLNPRPRSEDLSKYYPSDYRAYKKVKTRKRRLADRISAVVLRAYYGYGSNGRMASLLKRILLAPLFLLFSLNPRNSVVIPYHGSGRLLDIGCGSGKFLHFARGFGWDVHGVELDKEAARYAREELGMDVRTGVLSDQEYEAASFDVVRMSHVIEHVPNPMAELRRIREILKDDGRFVIMIPNIGSALAERFGDCWFALDAPRHLFSFSRQTITMLFEKAGFKVVRITQDWNACTLRQSLRYVGKERGGLLSKLAGFKRLMRLANMAVALLGQGDVIVVWARKA